MSYAPYNLTVYNKIKKSEQLFKLNHYYCEIEPDFLYMGSIYEAASILIPKDYVIIDLGCYMAAQAFLFDEFNGYIGVDNFDTKDSYPLRFYTENTMHITDDIRLFLKNVITNGYIENLHSPKVGMEKVLPQDCYVIANAVTALLDDATKQLLLNTFPNVAIEYPGEESCYQGILKEG